MSSSATDRRLAVATDVHVGDDGMRVRFSDGRSQWLRFVEYDFLRQATPDQRAGCIVDDKGTVLWWQDLREGISVAGLLGVSETELERFAGLT